MTDALITCGYCRAQIQPRDPFHVHGYNECLCGAEPRHNQYFHDGPTADALTPPSLPEKRTLADYRPQHDEDCAIYHCVVCGELKTEIHHWSPPVDDLNAWVRHSFNEKPCSCGLDALIASLRVERSQRSEEEKDSCAELIHQPIPDVAETEPRLTCGHRSDQGVTEGIVCMREDGHYGDHGASGDGWGASWPQKLGSHGNPVSTGTSGSAQSEALKNSSSLCSSCPALEAEIKRLKEENEAIIGSHKEASRRAEAAEASLAALQEQIDQVYALARGPIEQAKAIPLGQWVKTRFVHIEDFNEQIISRDWQPIASAPKDYERAILVCARPMPASHDGGVDVAIWEGPELGFLKSGGGVLHYPPTHWMPLPSPPSEARRLLQLEDHE